MLKYWQLYVLMLPGLLYFIIFKIGPVWGLGLAFYDYNIFGGFAASEFVGFKNFIDVAQYDTFLLMFRNTLAINIINLTFFFPAPIILALLINEIRNTTYKRFAQTIVYLPHFLSWVVIAGLTFFLLSTDVGAVNKLIRSAGREPIPFLSNPAYFWWLLLGQNIWREAGWGTILFLASMSQINPELYDASTIDGANRLQQVFRITIPSIIPTIIVLFIMRMGRMMDVAFEQVLLMRNPFVYNVSEVFNTYSYNQGVSMGNYDIGTTVDIYKSVIGLFLVIISNAIIKKTGNEGLY